MRRRSRARHPFCTIARRPGGETGIRGGLKNLCPERGVWVRIPPRARMSLTTLDAPPAQRLRRRRVGAGIVAAALITAGAVGTGQWLHDDSPGASSAATSPAPVTVATSDDGRSRLVVGRREGQLCAQLLDSGEEFDPTFCGAYELELQMDGVATGFGPSEESPDLFSYGMVTGKSVTVRVQLGDGRTIEGDAFPSPHFPDVRFFLVRLPHPFSGIDAVAALDGTGKRVGHG